jgi:class 3 adenylate cyclase
MRTCDVCGEANGDDARYCTACGSALVPDRRPESLEVRKTVTVLFCDVVGSTALGEATDPETTRNVMTRYAQEMTRVIGDHGGTVERFVGDEVMAVFGVPVVHEDDALRAVRAATAMRRRLAELSTELRETWGVELECRMGINTGEVVAGDPGAGHTFVTGDAVNLGKRLEQSAAPGEILIGTATYPLVKDAVRVGPRELFTAKGKREPVERFRLDDVDASAAGFARRLDAPLVDRVDDLERLAEAIDAAFGEERCVIVSIVGPAGIGKSRLALELARRWSGKARIAFGRCLPYGSGITYWPVVELVRDLGGLERLAAEIGDGDNARAAIDSVRSAVSHSHRIASNDEVFWGVRRLLEALAAREPVLVCLEDMHWAEPTMLDLVDYVAAFARGPIVLLCNGRSELLEARPAWARFPIAELGHLTPAETGELVAGLGIDDEAVRARIAATAEGNPLFAEQLAAMVVDTGADTGETLELPASVHALISARLDVLEAPERRLLERAAVIGKEFWWSAVADLSSVADRPRIGGRLIELTRKGLVHPVDDDAAGEHTFSFRHALIRDVAYAAMPKSVRSGLHEEFAEWLQSQTVRGYGEHLEIIGYHAEQAFRLREELGLQDERTRELATHAADLLARAGRRAAARDDIPAAIVLLERADALLGDESAARGAVRHTLGRGLWEIGENERALTVLDAAVVDACRAGDVGAEWRARLDAAAFRVVLGTEDDLRSVATRAVDVLAGAGDEAGLALAWRRLAFADRRDGRYGASVAPSERALEHARAAQDAYEETRAVDSLCTGLLYGPTPAGEAAARCREILAGADGRPVLQANVLASLAELEGMLGRFEEARAAYDRSRSIYEELGLRMPLAGLTTIGVELALLADDTVAAEAEAQRGLAALEGTGLEAELAPLLAEVLLRQGRDTEADAALADVADEQRGVPWRVRLRTARARLLVRGTDAARAVDLAHEAVALAGTLDDVNLSADAHAALADVLEHAGQPAQARAARHDARVLYERKGNIVAARAVRPA